MSSYFRIEDTRQPHVEMFDPLEWWERVMDCLPKNLQEFVDNELQEHRSKIGNLMRQNAALLQEIKELKHD